MADQPPIICPIHPEPCTCWAHSEKVRSDPETVKRLLADLSEREERQPSGPVPGSRRAAAQGYGK